MSEHFKSILMTISLFFAPIVPLMLLIGFAIFVDTVFGIVASKRIGTPITSRKLSRILTKSLTYMSLIFIAYGIDYVLMDGILKHYFGITYMFTKIVGVIIVVVEVFSIDEKLRKMNDNKGLWFYTKKVLGKVKSLISEAKDIKADIDEIKPS